MIYLIPDTNMWLYLANGLDPFTAKHHDDLHFQLLANLKDLRDRGEICILINDIVIEEWKRNKEHARAKINKLSKKLDNPANSFNELKKYVTTKIELLEEEYLEGLKGDIKSNEDHLVRVEDFLFNDCLKVDISLEQKVKIFDLSLHNKAPFHNKKNNIADAAILLSATEFLERQKLGETVSAIFVSNNFTDFTDGKNRDKFHPDIAELLLNVNIQFQRVLPEALKVSEEIIQEIEAHRKYETLLESISFICRTPHCQSNEYWNPYGYLDKDIEVKREPEVVEDPNQLLLYDELPHHQRKELISRLGSCINCGTTHLECPCCGELTYCGDDESIIECIECDTELRFVNDRKTNKIQLVWVQGTSEEDETII